MMSASLGLSGLLVFAFQLCFAGSTLLELPAVPDQAWLLAHPGCIIRYNGATLQPDWVAYRLTAREAQASEASRTNTFRPDPELQKRLPSASDSDYARSGYDRGHLAPAADMRRSLGSMIASFFFSNIAPQEPSLNRGIWSKLEDAVRGEAVRSGAVYLASGPIFYNDQVTRARLFIGPARIPVPDAFFKVLLVHGDTGSRTIAFILPNGPTNLNLFQYAITVDEAERITGFDFFHYLPDSEEASLEASFDPSSWFTK